jgi:hypothetical protein
VAATSSSMDVFAAISGLAIAVVVVLGSAYGLRHAISYSLQSSSLDIRMLGMTIRRVSLSDIDQVEVISFKSLIPIGPSFRRDLFISLKWCGYRERVVAIRRRSGLVKRIIVSQEDPEAFASILTRASAHTGAGPGTVK